MEYWIFVYVRACVCVCARDHLWLKAISGPRLSEDTVPS